MSPRDIEFRPLDPVGPNTVQLASAGPCDGACGCVCACIGDDSVQNTNFEAQSGHQLTDIARRMFGMGCNDIE